MAKKMKDYQIFKCPFCSCEYYDETARDGKKVGDPMIVCPSCSKKSYRSSILEPSLISADRYFDIRFSSLYGNFRIAIILVYAVFLFFILVKREFTLSLCLVVVAVIIFLMYGIIRLIHKKMFINSDEYNSEITHSLKRLADIPYAKMVIKSQGIEKNSVYYYELNENKNK